MFTRVGRRLALLNAVVVVAVIALTGVLILLLLQRALTSEEERSLQDRVSAATRAWSAEIAASQPIRDPATHSDSEEGSESETDEAAEGNDDEESSPLETGDTFLFAFDRNGVLLIDERGLPLSGIPDIASVTAALGGKSDSRTVHAGDDNVRILTQPIMVDGVIVGAVQGARGLGEHESQRKLVLTFTFIGIALGVFVAVPAGLFLSRRAMQPIQESFDQQRAFVSDASHELRTPLSVIRAQAELIQRLAGGETSDINEEAGIVVAEVDEMNRLVGDLLLLARIDENGETIAHAPVELAELVRTSAASFAESAIAAGLNLNVHAQGTAVVSGDGDRLRQIVRIFIDNAIRYTPRGGSIDVATEHVSGNVRVSVRDTGIGIAPQERERIFDRFYRSDKARSRVSGGTGLGLAIARALVHAHGGHIGVESIQGAGSTFWFTIPSSRDHDHSSRAGGSDPGSGGVANATADNSGKSSKP